MRKLLIAGCAAVGLLAGVGVFAQDEAMRLLQALEVHRGHLLLGTSVEQMFEGSTNDSFETTLTVTDPTADRTITLPNDSGTVILGASALTIEAGEATLDGNNPTRVTTTNLITECVITNQAGIPPADDPNSFTIVATAGGTTLDIYAWKNISGTDPTQVASGDSDDVVAYICVGT